MDSLWNAYLTWQEHTQSSLQSKETWKIRQLVLFRQHWTKNTYKVWKYHCNDAARSETESLRSPPWLYCPLSWLDNNRLDAQLTYIKYVADENYRNYRQSYCTSGARFESTSLAIVYLSKDYFIILQFLYLWKVHLWPVCFPDIVGLQSCMRIWKLFL